MKTKIHAPLALLTALTFVLSSCASVSSLFATPTPTPTITSTPTPTFTPTPTASPTPIPEAYTESLHDGSTRFVDLKMGYALTFQPNWLVINLAIGDPVKVLQDAIRAHPSYYADSLQGYVQYVEESEGVDWRMVAVTGGNFGANITIDQETSNLPCETIGENIVEKWKAVDVSPRHKLTVRDYGVRKNHFGVSYFMMDRIFYSPPFEFLENPYSPPRILPGLTNYEQYVCFSTGQYSVGLSLGWGEVGKDEGDVDEILPMFVEIIDTIELLRP